MFGARHPPRHGDLCRHRYKLQKTLCHHPFPCIDPPSVPPRSTSFQLVDALVALYSETPNHFHRYTCKFVTPFVERHMPRTSVVLAPARLGDRGSRSITVGTASSRVHLRLRVGMDNIQQGGLIPILPVWSVSEISSSNNPCVNPRVPVCGDRFAAPHLVWDFQPLQRAGNRA